MPLHSSVEARQERVGAAGASPAPREIYESIAAAAVPQLEPAGVFGTVAHELRAPIQALLLGTELLADDAEALTPVRHRALVESLRRQALWVQALLENLLSAAALREGRLHLTRRPVALADLLAEIEPVVRPLLAQRDQELRISGAVTNGAASGLIVMADPLRLGQVLINLLHNASKFGPPAAPIDVVVSTGRGRGGRAVRTGRPSLVRVVVADRGTGVPSSGAERLFLPFVRAASDEQSVDMSEAAASARGVGLGLSIVQSIVEAHGGQVGVDNRPGGGAAFWFEVPAAPQTRRRTER